MLLRRTLLLALALLALVGCSKRSGDAPAGAAAAPVAKVKLALDWVPEPEFGGFYAARETGVYARYGLDVEILGGGAGVPVVQMVASGRAEFGTTGADAVVMARARGADVVALFASFQTSPQAILVHASRGLRSLGELFEKGGTLALEPGLPYAAYLRAKYGFDRMQIVPYDGGIARFLSDAGHAQQCFVTSEPLAARRKGSDPQTFLVADAGFDPYATVVVTRRELLAREPERVRAFVLATAEGWRAYGEDPRATNAAMGKLNPAMDAATFAEAAAAQRPLVETDETRRAGIGAMTRARWETLARQLAELHIVDRAPPADDLFVTVAR